MRRVSGVAALEPRTIFDQVLSQMSQPKSEVELFERALARRVAGRSSAPPFTRKRIEAGRRSRSPSSSGRPSATIRPPAMIATRSGSRWASSM